MSSYRQHLYHIVFRTKESIPTIKQVHVNELYAYITGIIKHKQSHLYRINDEYRKLLAEYGITPDEKYFP
jgi:putative transposase